MSNPTPTFVDVTPAMAAEWLSKNNTMNRTMRDSKVIAYARDMTNGAWKINGDSIRFAEDGTLLDGQHRLAAIVRSSVTIPFIVVWGLPREAQDTMDIGAHRALRDQLHLKGIANSNEVSAIARRSYLAEVGSVGGGGNQVGPTQAELLHYINANPEVVRAAEVALRSKGNLPCAPTAIGACYFMCARMDIDKAEYFWVHQVIDGLGLSDSDPAYALRNRVQKEVMDGRRRMSADDVYRYGIVAWNHYRAGNRLTKLQAPKGGWSASALPQPK